MRGRIFTKTAALAFTLALTAGSSVFAQTSWPCGLTANDKVTATLNAEGVLTVRGMGKMKEALVLEKIPLHEQKQTKLEYERCVREVENEVAMSGAIGPDARLKEQFGIAIACGNAGETERLKKMPMPWDDYKDGITNVIIENGVTSIGSGAFGKFMNLTSVTIGNSVASIGKGSFLGCSNLASVAIGSSVTSLGDGAFGECSRLTNVTIPNGVASIGESAFRDCAGLTSVVIGNRVTTIGNDAFHGCSKIELILMLNLTPPKIGNRTFLSVNKKTCVLIVPEGSMYRMANNWKDFSDIRFGTATEEVILAEQRKREEERTAEQQRREEEYRAEQQRREDERTAELRREEARREEARKERAWEQERRDAERQKTEKARLKIRYGMKGWFGGAAGGMNNGFGVAAHIPLAAIGDSAALLVLIPGLDLAGQWFDYERWIGQEGVSQSYSEKFETVNISGSTVNIPVMLRVYTDYAPYFAELGLQVNLPLNTKYKIKDALALGKDDSEKNYDERSAVDIGMPWGIGYNWFNKHIFVGLNGVVYFNKFDNDGKIGQNSWGLFCGFAI